MRRTLISETVGYSVLQNKVTKALLGSAMLPPHSDTDTKNRIEIFGFFVFKLYTFKKNRYSCVINNKAIN
jgi:hypothetical protein